MSGPLGQAPMSYAGGPPLASAPGHFASASMMGQAMPPPMASQCFNHGPPPAMVPAPVAPPVPYEVVRKQVAERLNSAIDKRRDLVGHLDELTEGAYSEGMKKTFSASRKANLDDVDWRVPRLMYCKDPKHNGSAEAHAFEVEQRKMADSQVLEEQLAQDATDKWAKALAVVGERPPPEERTVERRIPFVEARPNYNAEDDVWSRTLELRTLDEAMRGDVSKPLPRPAVHTEEYQNFHEGKYVKDDCPIA